MTMRAVCPCIWPVACCLWQLLCGNAGTCFLPLLTAGLSVARVGAIEDGCLVLHGADIVDGSPVLDIKPYLPYVDSVPSAWAPSWVR